MQGSLAAPRFANTKRANTRRVRLPLACRPRFANKVAAAKIHNMKFALLLPLLLLSACSSVKKDVRAPDSHAATGSISSYARSLIGAPYKYGGNSPNTGFDCSGFVGHVFKRSLGISLPRNAQQISRQGQAVKLAQLREGDLVFYNTNNRSFSHVGIFLGDDRFIHAPSGGGSVRIEKMGLDYWRKHYNGARRITSRR
ncbi:MAG: C40 family peptidase [Gallionella sp.]|nr:C40 family peptidase [Gallionella sp.]